MNCVILGVIVFLIGLAGVLVRSNLLFILMSIELMLSATNIVFIGFSKINGSVDGHVFAIFIFIIAACEAAIGLSIIIAGWRLIGDINIQKWRRLSR